MCGNRDIGLSEAGIPVIYFILSEILIISRFSQSRKRCILKAAEKGKRGCL